MGPERPSILAYVAARKRAFPATLWIAFQRKLWKKLTFGKDRASVYAKDL
jgi:hypothetical protein